MADERRRRDDVLDAYARLLRAMQVLHHEADTDLPFDSWVETTLVRFSEHARTFTEPAIEAKVLCPEENCFAEYRPTGERRVMGKDDKGQTVYFQRWECAAGHWHTKPEN